VNHGARQQLAGQQLALIHQVSTQFHSIPEGRCAAMSDNNWRDNNWK